MIESSLLPILNVIAKADAFSIKTSTRSKSLYIGKILVDIKHIRRPSGSQMAGRWKQSLTLNYEVTSLIFHTSVDYICCTQMSLTFPLLSRYQIVAHFAMCGCNYRQ